MTSRRRFSQRRSAAAWGLFSFSPITVRVMAVRVISKSAAGMPPRSISDDAGTGTWAGLALAAGLAFAVLVLAFLVVVFFFVFLLVFLANGSP